MEGKDTKYRLNKQIICKDNLIDLSFPLVMGVINVTPDSFYKGSRNDSVNTVLNRVKIMVDQGVDIIDVGGISTRSGADLMTEKEELERILPVIQEIRQKYPNLLVSIDTFRSSVAKQAVECGAHIINDVYGGRMDSKMFEVVAELNVPYILMHSRGDASNMQSLCYYEDVVQDVILELSKAIKNLRELGVKDVIIDPGFGFAKNLEQNYELMRGLSYLELLNCPLLVGISRKSMVYKFLECSPETALNGTTVLNTIALLNNTSIIRVHDVKEARETIKIITEYQNIK
ncbi:MAG: dihydropteroate synthase [Brumimicrobium sp.]|nr:dihydropteroate synthase [Brumimicrobium sp.]